MNLIRKSIPNCGSIESKTMTKFMSSLRFHKAGKFWLSLSGSGLNSVNKD